MQIMANIIIFLSDLHVKYAVRCIRVEFPGGIFVAEKGFGYVDPLEMTATAT